MQKNQKEKEAKYSSRTIISKTEIEIDNIKIAVEFKRIKKVNLKVQPPSGKVSVSAPFNIDINYLKNLLISKIDWIKKHQEKISNLPKKAEKEYISGETHYFLGKAFLLEVLESKSRIKVFLNSDKITMQVPFRSSKEERERILYEFYKLNLKKLAPVLILKWEKIIGVKTNALGIRKTKTRWGSCKVVSKRIWLNSELAKKPVEVIEYVIAHELVHLLERHHNKRFYDFLTQFLPNWEKYKAELNKYD